MRWISFIILSIVATHTPLWIWICVALVYSFIYAPYELFVISVCIDAYFSDLNISYTYMYTTCTVLLCIGVTIIKPYLAIYNRHHYDVQDF
jgi:hypothetical protein